jgi:hypothetical protein
MQKRPSLIATLTLAILALSLQQVPAHAQFGSGHVFLYDNVWSDNNILEYDATGNFVRDFRTATGEPAFNGLSHMRWGPDGHIYNVGYRNSGDFGVFEWQDVGGTLSLTFYPKPVAVTLPGPVEGFSVLNNGNWLIPQLDYLVEYDRTTWSPTSFTLGLGGGLQGSWMHSGDPYIVGAGSVSIFDPTLLTEIGFRDTGYDNEDITVSGSGLVAVNNQWHIPPVTDPDIVKIYDASLNFVDDVRALNTHWAFDRGLTFDDSDRLYIASRSDFKPETWLTIYDSNRNLIGF